MATDEQVREDTEALARAYIKAREAHEAAQEVEIRTKRAQLDAERQLVERLIENSAGKKGAKWTIDGKLFSIRRSSHISLTKENHDEVLGWLSLEMGRDAVQDYLEVKLDKSSVERWVKDQLHDKTKVEADFPDFLKLYTEPRISVSGWNHEDAPNPKQERQDA